ncbi:hypothetical protein HDN1F_05530 [gamma proteobacterium HdN1]|nr:hypothetical protein HDN1F_05530 [gamma proteobacterium HdN1]
MRILLSLLVLVLSSPALAIPTMYSFTGTTEKIGLSPFTGFEDYGYGELSNDPSKAIVKGDGNVVFNGDTSVSGWFIIDTDETSPSARSHRPVPLAYGISTQGAYYSFDNRDGKFGIFDQVTLGNDRFAWHVEGPNIKNSGGITSSVQQFSFLFGDTGFSGGDFALGGILGEGLIGGLSGSIHELRKVPEPHSQALLMIGLLGLFAVARSRRSCKA